MDAVEPKEPEPLRTLHQLVKEGETFTYDNFADKEKYGYPNALSPSWVSWVGRTEHTAKDILLEGSSGWRTLKEGLKMPYLGNGVDKFHRGKSMLLGALQIAIDLVPMQAAIPPASEPETPSRKVFVVHGHDELAKNALEGFLGEIGLEPIVLHRQPDKGRTIIEKFEAHSDVGFAFVLLTPDETAYLATEEDKESAERKTKKRARPNVLFEFGFFVGKLGRTRVCCLYTGDVELPSDVSGLLYKQYENSVEETFWPLQKELRAAGYSELKIPD